MSLWTKSYGVTAGVTIKMKPRSSVQSFERVVKWRYTLMWYRFLFCNLRVSWNEIWGFFWISIFGTLACNKHWSYIFEDTGNWKVLAGSCYNVPNLTEKFQTFNVTWHWVCWPNTYAVEVPGHSKETSSTVLLKRFNVFESVVWLLQFTITFSATMTFPLCCILSTVALSSESVG